MVSLFRKIRTKAVVLAAVFAFVIFPAIIISMGPSQAFAEEPPVSEVTTDPDTAIAAPVASFDFTAALPNNPQFMVGFDKPVNEADAANPANYFMTNVDPLLSKPSLTGYATVTYNAPTSQATVTMTNPSTVVVGEGSSWGVRDIHDSTGETTIAETTATPAANQASSSPGVPTITSLPNDKQMTWVWDEAIDTGIGASGIGSYGYELTKDSAVIAVGSTPSDIRTQTVIVVDDGDYVFRVWAIDNVGNISEPVEMNVSIVTTIPDPVIPVPVPEVVVDTPVFVPAESSELPLVEVAYIPFTPTPMSTTYSQVTVAIDDRASVRPPEPMTYSSNPSTPTTKRDDNGEVLSATVIASTSEGWKLFGIPWYIFAVAIAAGVTGWLWLRALLRSRRADDV